LNEKDTMFLDEGFAAFAGTGDEVAGAPVLRRIQVMPRGQAKIRDGRKCFISQEDIDSVLAHFVAQKNDVPFLVNHGEDVKYGGEAVGWIKKLEQDHVGVFAYVEWDPGITPLIRSKKLRYVSPGFKYKVDAAGNWRPIYLREGSLTNVPAIDDMLEAAAADLPSFQPSTADQLKPCDKHKADMKKCPDCSGKSGLNDPQENDMDEKTVAEFKEKQNALEAQFTAFTESITKTFAKMAEDIEAKILPGVTAAAEKHADAKLAEQRNEDAFTACLDGATTEGRLTAAQRATLMELTAGAHNPVTAAKFIATLPITVPVGSIVKPAGDPDLKAPKEEAQAAFMDRVVKFADENGTTIVAAETILRAEKK
jgi:phage I-like protein